MASKLILLITLLKCLSLVEALSIPVWSTTTPVNRLRQAVTVTDGSNTLRLDEFQKYSNTLYAVFNENYVVKFNSDLTLAWSNRWGTAHSFFGTQLQRLAISVSYVYFLSADSVYIMTTAGAAATIPGKVFSAGYTPLAIAYQSLVIYIVSKDSSNIVVISSFSASSGTFSLTSNYQITGVTTYTGKHNLSSNFKFDKLSKYLKS